MLEENEAFIYFFQTLLGIDYLHYNNIVHRDLKPENLLFDKDANIRICDFGWSVKQNNNTDMTFIGTLAYMAPEMLRRENYDFKVDIWALGVLLYEMLNGRAPFTGNSDAELAKAISTYNDDKLQYRNSIPVSLQNLISSMLRVSVRKRYDLDKIFEHEWTQKWAKHFGINPSSKRCKNYNKVDTTVCSPINARNDEKDQKVEETHIRALTNPENMIQNGNYQVNKNWSEQEELKKFGLITEGHSEFKQINSCGINDAYEGKQYGLLDSNFPKNYDSNLALYNIKKGVVSDNKNSGKLNKSSTLINNLKTQNLGSNNQIKMQHNVLNNSNNDANANIRESSYKQNLTMKNGDPKSKAPKQL